MAATACALLACPEDVTIFSIHPGTFSMPDKPVVMISSTARDLSAYRAQVMDACLRLDMFPRMIEHLPALPTDASRASLDLVDEADVYIGIFAHRYGYVPEGYDISITEMEYERAVERDIPRLIFLMHDDVAVLPKEFEIGEAAEKLAKLKERLRDERVVASFTTPEDLRTLIVQRLGEVKKQIDTAHTDESGQPRGLTLAESLHYVSEIPQPPESYIAHPYTLLQVRRLIGRKAEMELLTDWVTGKHYGDVSILNVVAIGGMGKSALTWAWFNDVAPQEFIPLAGRLWWSFYESDATFENFVTRALAYVSRQSLEEVEKLSLADQEDRLLGILDGEPFLIVLDGLERILTAYARLDAAYLRDDDVLDENTANRVVGALGIPPRAGESFVGKHILRKTADPRAGNFLRELANIRASRVLASTRLYPADLQTAGGTPAPHCAALFLTGLSDQDALDLWREHGAKGSREEMLPLFRAFDKHPLLLHLLAHEVAEFREAPGDFNAWRTANRDFDPFGIEFGNAFSQALFYITRALTPPELQTLYCLSGFRTPVSMGTLTALLVGGENEDQQEKPFGTIGELDRALTALEYSGLLGWDRRGNRYDLHPVVRSTVWRTLAADTRREIYQQIVGYYSNQRTIDWINVQTIEQLEPYIQTYQSLVGLGRTVEADSLLQSQIERFREAFVATDGDDDE